MTALNTLQNEFAKMDTEKQILRATADFICVHPFHPFISVSKKAQLPRKKGTQ